MMFKGGKVKDTKEEGMEKENEDKTQKSNGITIIIHKEKIPHPWDQDGVLKYISIVHVVIGLVLLGSSIYRDTATDANLWANTVFDTSLPQGYVSSALYTITGVLGILTTFLKRKLTVNRFLLINIFASIWTVVLTLSSLNIYHNYHHYEVNISNYIHFICSIIQYITTFTCVIISSEYMFYSKSDKAMKSMMKKGTLTTLSCLQIVIGIFLITCFMCVVEPFDFGGSFGASWLADGLWCGVFFIILGVTGCFVCRRASPRTVTTFILMNILGSIFAIVVMVTAGNSVFNATADRERPEMYKHYLGYPQDLHEDLVAYLQTDDFNCTKRTTEKLKYPNVPFYRAISSPFIPYSYNNSLVKYVLDLNFNGLGYMVQVNNVSLEETTSLEFLLDVDKCEEDRLKIISLDLSEVTDQIHARIAGIRVIYDVKLLVGIIAFIINVYICIHMYTCARHCELEQC